MTAQESDNAHANISTDLEKTLNNKLSQRLRRGVAAACIAAAASFAFDAPAAATTDYTDLWFNPAESGWGLNVIQQNRTVFATLFVYGPTGQPTWYVASALTPTDIGPIRPLFTGQLFRTSGPSFTGPFVGGVTATPVGTMTFSGDGNSALLTYSIDGVTYTKNVVRQTWDLENLSGTFVGVTAGNWSGCGNARNGYQENPANFTISQDNTALQIREDGPGYTCNYVGSVSQAGRMVAIAGGGTCGDGSNQTMTASNLTVGPNGIIGNVTFAQVGGTCTYTGRLAGVRRGS